MDTSNLPTWGDQTRLVFAELAVTIGTDRPRVVWYY
jgi:hypothetical protein